MSLKTFLVSAVAVALFAGSIDRVSHADAQPTAGATTTPSGRVFEIRKYYVLPGRLDALNARFRNHTTKLFEKHGMENVGYWVQTDGPEAGKVLVYILAFPSIEAKEAAWKGFNNDPEWKTVREASEKDGKIVERVESTLLQATDYSMIK